MSRAALFLAVPLLAAAAPESPPDTALLLAALAAAPDTRTAGEIEHKLEQAWYNQASPAVQILLDHAAMSVGHGQADAAVADTNAAVTLQPDLADVYRRRAEARYAAGDDKGAVADLAQALSRDKLMVPALMDLSRIAEAEHDNARALAAWKRVLELDPKTEGGEKRLDLLTRKVNGEPT